MENKLYRYKIVKAWRTVGDRVKEQYWFALAKDQRGPDFWYGLVMGPVHQSESEEPDEFAAWTDKGDDPVASLEAAIKEGWITELSQDALAEIHIERKEYFLRNGILHLQEKLDTVKEIS